MLIDFLFKKVNDILLHENKFYSFIHFFDDVDDFFIGVKNLIPSMHVSQKKKFERFIFKQKGRAKKN